MGITICQNDNISLSFLCKIIPLKHDSFIPMDPRHIFLTLYLLVLSADNFWWWWFCCSWSIVICTSHCLWGFCVCLCFGMHFFMSFLVLQSSRRGRESWLLCFYCLTYFFLLLMFCGSSSRCRGLVCHVWLWYFLIILTFSQFGPRSENVRHDLDPICLTLRW